MDGSHFDAHTRSLSAALSRRRAFGGVFAVAFALIAGRWADDAAAGRSGKGRRRRKKKGKGTRPPVCIPVCTGRRVCGAGDVCVCQMCYVENGSGECVRTQDPKNGRCPCGFAESNGECVKNQCWDCFENVGGICVPEVPGTAPNGICRCGFTIVGGICVPRYPLP